MTGLVLGARRERRGQLAERRRFFIGRETQVELRKLKGISHLSGQKMIHEAMTKVRGVDCWIVSDRKSIDDLLAAAVQLRAWLGGRRRPLGNLAFLKLPPLASLAAAKTIFNRVAWAEHWLPLAQLAEVLDAPNRQDLIIGGMVDAQSQTLTVYRGDFRPVTVPLSIFKPSGDGPEPDFDRFSIGEFGHTVCFGDYESSADAIFYEGDPAYRKARKERRRDEDKTFGACLRRLRLQSRLPQTDFAPLAARTIARIENGKIGKLQGKTLSIIARRLGVNPEAIETY